MVAGPLKFNYALSKPLVATDPLGLVAQVCCRLLAPPVGILTRQRHCYVEADDGTVYGLYPQKRNGKRVGLPGTDDLRDVGGRCEACDCIPGGSSSQNQCFRDAHNSYPIGEYSELGSNSNTYAGTLARKCCKDGVPGGLGTAPGIDDQPPSRWPTAVILWPPIRSHTF